MRESAEAKGRRYLVEGRLEVVERVGDRVRATCRGGDRVYELGFDPERAEWHCDCPALGRCAHLIALTLVASRRREP